MQNSERDESLFAVIETIIFESKCFTFKNHHRIAEIKLAIDEIAAALYFVLRVVHLRIVHTYFAC